MGVHPKFSEESECFNCAAFIPERPGQDHYGGTCHRHAPRPVHLLVSHVEAHGNPMESPGSETSPDIVWPKVDDQFFCCEWIPKFTRRATEARS